MAMLDNVVQALGKPGGKAHYSEIHAEYSRITGECVTKK